MNSPMAWLPISEATFDSDSTRVVVGFGIA
jgi:hypothetical protein